MLEVRMLVFEMITTSCVHLLAPLLNQLFACLISQKKTFQGFSTVFVWCMANPTENTHSSIGELTLACTQPS